VETSKEKIVKRVVIDARESGTSTGRYVDKLVEYLHKLKPAFEIIVLTKSPRVEYLKGIAPGFKIVEADYEEFGFAEQIGFKHFLRSLKADLVHFSMPQQPIWYKGKVVTTVHDLTTLRFTNPAKNKFVFNFKQLIFGHVIKRVARKSAAVISGTQFAKDDLVNYTGINPDKVTVTLEAADAIKAPAQPYEALKDKRYILYVGRPTPHKNLERLIDAFVALKATQPDLHLVLVGKKDANYRRIEKSVQARQLRNVHFTDFATDGQLRWLYEHCQAYIFPSLSEGFGLPGLEAMLQGAPVVSSDATCLPEVYGEAAHYFDPLDVQSMADAINEVLTNKELRSELIARGHEQVKKYSWQRMAEQTLAVYEKVLAG
jgi:glycosyltransferase involved in cell wall biosynthesis